jgi:hypothetical protein
MKVYILCKKEAAVKIDGQYVGVCKSDGTYIEGNVEKGSLVEIIPNGNFRPHHFIWNKQFITEKHEYMRVFQLSMAYILEVTAFPPYDSSLKIFEQTNFEGYLVTAFRLGGNYISMESANFALHELPPEYTSMKLITRHICGNQLLCVQGDGRLAIIDGSGKLALECRADVVDYDGDKLKIAINPTVRLHGKITIEYNYDGSTFIEADKKFQPSDGSDDKLSAFAFFESLLYIGSCEDFLCADLLPKANMLKDFIGDFKYILPPTPNLCEESPATNAVILAYDIGENYYKLKPYALTFKEGKVENIYKL